MVASKSIGAKVGLGKDDVQVLDYEATKGPACWEKAVLVEPSDVFKSIAADAAKRVEKNLKRKASYAAKTQWKKARYNSVDNSLSSKKAYSRYNVLYNTCTFYANSQWLQA